MVIFNGKRLILARKSASLKKTELASLIEVSPSTITFWESGKKIPNGANVKKLAAALSVDVGFFEFSDVNDRTETTPYFRSLRSTPKATRDQAIAFGRIVLDLLNRLELYVDTPKLNIPHGDDFEEVRKNPSEAAKYLRKYWGIGEGPIGHSIRLAENNGIAVVYCPMVTSSVDAFSFSIDDRPIMILNSMKNDYYRQRFDVAHEIGHILMHDDEEPGIKSVESQANDFAAEFLMPEDLVRDQLPSRMSRLEWMRLKELKEYWGVSMQALLFRSRQLGIMNDVSYRNSMIYITKQGWRMVEPGDMKYVESVSLIPVAIKALEEVGIPSSVYLNKTVVPGYLAESITARLPSIVGD